MNLRPYQEPAVAWLSRRRRGIVEAPAGSGKTVMAAAALHRVLTAVPRSRKARVGWMANTLEQCRQADEALAMFPDIRQPGSGAGLATVTVRCAAAGTDWSDRDVLVVDECHHGPAPEWRRQIETCSWARWGLTATPDFEGDGADSKARALVELFGPDRFKVERDGIGLAKARVVVMDASDPVKDEIDAAIQRLYRARLRFWRGDTGKLWSMAAWQACVEVGIVGNQSRTEAALRVARAHAAAGASVLVLVNQVEHAKAFAAAVPGAVACYSGMGAKARRHAIYDFKNGKLRCLVATSLADEGLDVPRANVLVLVSGGRSAAKAEQRTGRVLRQFAGKEHAVIYDFADRQHPLMEKHAAARQAVYRRLGYEVLPAKRVDELPGVG